ncbi:hypothetical protein [Arenimonas sp.]|uniref:hypothetical protein n=1 Tax=Arenimonas sp. TaxID=1872635 RepID=UPI0039E6229C
MTWLAIAALLLLLYLMFKIAKFLVKLTLAIIAVGIVFWLVAPAMGMTLPF